MIEPTDLGEREKYRQRRRTPRPTREPSGQSGSQDVEEAYDLVPEIGEGYRWYDWPYRFLRWLGSGWRRKLLGERMRNWTFLGQNFLLPFAEHDRDKTWPLDNLHHNVFVPSDEHVKVAGIWAIELFPPAELPAFERALQKNGWLRRQRWASHEPDNLTVLERSRSGTGASWWRLIDVVSRNSNRPVFDGVRADLPAQFDMVKLRAIRVGEGLTAVLAEFELNESAASSVDQEWHRDHEPMLLPTKGGGRPRNLDRQWAAFWQTQTARKKIHDAARGWLTQMVPGFFASHSSPQLLLDLLLLDQFDPTQEPYVEISQEERIKLGDAYRAIGLDHHGSRNIVSEHLPKLVLSPVKGYMYEALGDDPTWTLWGKRDAVIEAFGPDGLGGFGGNADRAIAYRVQDMHNLLVMLAVSAFLDVTSSRYAELRDRASIRHGKFTPGAIRELRRNLLDLSLNIATVRRDVTAFWASNVWSWDRGARFEYVLTPWLKARDKETGRKVEEPISLNDRLEKQHAERFKRLSEADGDYRDILSTVASLGASADAFKVGRWALLIAFASLAVALGTIVLSDIGCDSVMHQLFGWPDAAECASSP
jgi:hypothetical protein